MWRKLLFVVLLVGIGYLIWRRMQSSSEPTPPTSLTAAGQPPAPPATSAAPPAAGGPRPVVTRVHRGAPPPVPPTGASSGTTSASSGPRPVITRVHRGAPPAVKPASAPVSAATADSRSTEATTGAAPAPEADPTTNGVVEPMGTAPRDSEPAMPPAPDTPPAGDAAPAVAAPAEAPAAAEAGESVGVTDDQAVDEEAVAAALTANNTSNLTPIDINRADRDALIALPGIGPVLADRIIAYREAHGPFKSVDDLIDISGIGERNIQLFRKLVYVDTNA